VLPLTASTLSHSQAAVPSVEAEPELVKTTFVVPIGLPYVTVNATP
jgi:hypothetical protein